MAGPHIPTAAFEPQSQTLEKYRPGQFKVECMRCRRQAVVNRLDMLKRFGDITLAECARSIAADKGCGLALTYGQAKCSVQVFEVPVWFWARLMDARLGGWQAYLICHRRFAALKSVDSCPEVVALDVLSLISVLGDDFTLERLPHRCKCPYCGTSHVDVEWHVPKGPPASAPVAFAPVLQMRPLGAAVGRQKFNVVKR